MRAAAVGVMSLSVGACVLLDFEGYTLQQNQGGGGGAGTVGAGGEAGASTTTTNTVVPMFGDPSTVPTDSTKQLAVYDRDVFWVPTGASVRRGEMNAVLVVESLSTAQDIAAVAVDANYIYGARGGPAGPIVRLNKDGTFDGEVNSGITTAMQWAPVDMLVADGVLYVANGGEDIVYAMNADGTAGHTGIPVLGAPSELTANSTDVFTICELDGTVARVTGTAFSQPANPLPVAAAASDVYLYVAQGAEMLAYGLPFDGTTRDTQSQAIDARALAVHGNDLYAVTNGGRLHILRSGEDAFVEAHDVDLSETIDLEVTDVAVFVLHEGGWSITALPFAR